MFKLIIVEDENKTRSALLSCLPWESLGITEVGEASNGVQALEWIKRERPHLVITDIRMPEMDGLELVGRIREAYPHTGVIILSAYSDIPYLKSAIKYNAVDYLFKPVDPEELEQAISRALDRVRVSSQMSRVHGVLEEHLPLLREQWLKAIVNGVKIGDAEWEN
ncbi:MAG: response regulator, partial [Paenibacillaceae bacterium]|nr:response regulator [Paenibacillaceae bacterium]